MPRTGITEAQMLEAITALKSRGENVTKLSVRRELGNTGSFGTIQAFLARWRGSQGPAQAQPPASAAPMPESVDRAMAAVWNTARAEAKAEVEAERQVLAATLAENEEALKALDLQLQEKENQVEAQALQAAQAAQDLQAAQERIAALSLELGEARSKTEAAQERIQDLQGRLTAAEAHDREAQATIADLSKQNGILTGKAETHAQERKALEDRAASLEARIRDLEPKKP